MACPADAEKRNRRNEQLPPVLTIARWWFACIKRFPKVIPLGSDGYQELVATKSWWLPRSPVSPATVFYSSSASSRAPFSPRLPRGTSGNLRPGFFKIGRSSRTKSSAFWND